MTEKAFSSVLFPVRRRSFLRAESRHQPIEVAAENDHGDPVAGRPLPERVELFLQLLPEIADAALHFLGHERFQLGLIRRARCHGAHLRARDSTPFRR
jgi:hypothetical protein